MHEAQDANTVLNKSLQEEDFFKSKSSQSVVDKTHHFLEGLSALSTGPTLNVLGQPTQC